MKRSPEAQAGKGEGSCPHLWVTGVVFSSTFGPSQDQQSSKICQGKVGQSCPVNRGHKHTSLVFSSSCICPQLCQCSSTLQGAESWCLGGRGYRQPALPMVPDKGTLEPAHPHFPQRVWILKGSSCPLTPSLCPYAKPTCRRAKQGQIQLWFGTRMSHALDQASKAVS